MEQRLRLGLERAKSKTFHLVSPSSSFHLSVSQFGQTVPQTELTQEIILTMQNHLGT